MNFTFLFFERVAKKIQKEELDISIKPNHYKYSDVLNFIKKHGFTITYNDSTSYRFASGLTLLHNDTLLTHLEKKEIRVTYENPKSNLLTAQEYNYLLAQIFYNIGLMLYNNIKSSSTFENLNLLGTQLFNNWNSNYSKILKETLRLWAIERFVLEMLFPEDMFSENLKKHIVDGKFDLNATAEDFNMDYTDVLIKAKILKFVN